VEEGLKLFEGILESMPTHTWHIFYNLGNALAALGRHRDAIAKYEQAIRLDASRPEIWKNLASSYHRVGNHRDEMKCFDKALELDPVKPEALVSKAISLMVDFGKPEEAMPLLETAVRSGSNLAIRWPQIWYWLARACHKSGAHTAALSWIENGLAHRPGDRQLKTLKSNVLAALVGENEKFIDDARAFWQDESREQPLNYEVRSRLARLEGTHGNDVAAWRLLDECFALLEIRPATSLRGSGFDTAACTRALKWLPQYAVYRETCPVSVYWNPDDPLYDLPFAPPESPETQVALTTFLSVPFGLAVQQLEESPHRETKSALIAFFDTLREGIALALSESARTLASLIPPPESGGENIARKVADLMLFLGLISLREFGRQRGWIASQFQISSACLDRAMEGYDESKIEKDVIAGASESIFKSVSL
jgi:tetratricopeptide (TPR) repeat protein